MNKKPHIAIVFAFNDDIHEFQGGSRNGFKKNISYFDQFLLAVYSINKNWSQANFDFSLHVVYEREFSVENLKTIQSLDVKMHQMTKVYPQTGLRHLAFMIDVDCDYILALDNDIVAMKPPNFDFTKDALLTYGGSRYNKQAMQKICDALNMRMPNVDPINEKNGWTINANEYEDFYNSHEKTKRLFPAVNAGALMIKKSLARQFSHTLAAAMAKHRIYSNKYLNIDPSYIIQPVYGIALNEVTENWAPFEKGFNLLLSNSVESIKQIYLRYTDHSKISMVHYINYPDSDPLKIGLKKMLVESLKVKNRKVIKTSTTHYATAPIIDESKKYKIIGYKYKKWNEIFDRDEPIFKNAYMRYKKGGFLYDGSVNINQIKQWSKVLNEGGNITISRFNDGEWAFILKNKWLMNTIIKKRHPNNGEHLIRSGNIMKEIIDSKPTYMISIDKYSLENKLLKHEVRSNLHKIKNLIGSGVFNIWAMWTGFQDLFQILSERKVLIVGPSEMKNLPIIADHIITDQKTSVYRPMVDVNRIKEYMIENYQPNMVILYSCSFTAKVAIDEMYKLYGNKITQLDIGASIIPFYGKIQRPWSNEILKQLKEINYIEYEK